MAADAEVGRLAGLLKMQEVDREGMVDGHDQATAGPQHAPQLGQRTGPVLQVIQHQGRDDVVEHTVGVGQRAAQVGDPQVRIGT